MLKIGLRLLAVVAFGAVASAPAHAQATRTWVSGVGDDVNPCSRTAPCKTFAGAISKTAAGGEINCLDPGGYGTITITKSITIDCTGTMGSILNSGVNGVVINDSLTATPGTIQVRLRGLVINGAGTTPGINGIRFIRGRSLVVEDVFIQNQRGSSGISIAPTAGLAEVYITNSAVVDSGNLTTHHAVELRPTGSGSVQASLRNVNVLNNAGSGVRLDSTASTGSVSASIENSQISGGFNGLSVAAGAASIVLVKDTQIFNNSNVGIATDGAQARVRANNTTITANALGLSAAAGSFINDLGGNVLVGNTTNGAFN